MDQAAPQQSTRRYLHYLPVALFGSVMGMTGLSVAWQLAHVQYGAPSWIAQSVAVVAAVTFVALSFAYAVKLWSAADAVKAEFLHPIAGNLFGTILISLLLLPIVIAPVNLRIAQILRPYSQTRYKTLTVGELEIFYREAGPEGAPTILLLHGFPTSSHMFRDLIPLLADRFHLIAPDYPGFGYSSAPSSYHYEASRMTRPSGGGCVAKWSRGASCQ